MECLEVCPNVMVMIRLVMLATYPFAALACCCSCVCAAQKNIESCEKNEFVWTIHVSDV